MSVLFEAENTDIGGTKVFKLLRKGASLRWIKRNNSQEKDNQG